MAVPLLERQLAPIPDPPPITEERLQEKGVMVCIIDCIDSGYGVYTIYVCMLQRDSYNLVHKYYSQEMTAVTNEKI